MSLPLLPPIIFFVLYGIFAFIVLFLFVFSIYINNRRNINFIISTLLFVFSIYFIIYIGIILFNILLLAFYYLVNLISNVYTGFDIIYINGHPHPFFVFVDVDVVGQPPHI
jgi:hypothetical protein